MCFNLLEESWIPILRCNGQFERLGIRRTLTEAGTIRQIAASNPMDAFAVHRFLLTLLYWKANIAGGVEALRRVLLSGAVPPDITSALDAEALHFGLIDAEQPFLQDLTAQREKPKSAGSLFAEMACGTNVAHFHHGDDATLRLCLPCAAMGMLRLVPWTQSGGAGLSPAVHNAPPIMALACGRNLADTLGLNLVQLDGYPGTARWSGHFVPSDPAAPIPYLEALTWNPRRVYLGRCPTHGICWRCGCREVTVVGPIVYAKNDKTKANKEGRKTIPFIWQDPSAFYHSRAPYVAMKSYDEYLAMDGRDLISLLDRNSSYPTSIVVRENQAHEGWRLMVPSTNPANNKNYDHRQVELPKLSTDAVRSLVPSTPSPWRQQEIDGWPDLRAAGPKNGAVAFIRSATRLLTDGDWAVLASAAYRSMHESTRAFDLLVGILWPLRKRAPGLPSRNVAWLVLKLMGAFPANARVLSRDPQFCPLDLLAKRQLDERLGERGVRSPYPASLPRGPRLEAALRNAVDKHLRLRTEPSIDWPGLCRRLNRLLD